MSTRPAQDVLLVVIDDDPISLDLVRATLEQDGVEILTETNPAAAVSLIFKRRPQIVISDLMMPGMTGIEVLEAVNRLDPTIEVILLTAHYSTESAVDAIQRGAADYICKPVDTRKLRDRIDVLIQSARRLISARSLDSQLLQAHRFRGIIGRSPLMIDVFARIERIAPHYRTVLVTGPTGAGKELVAKALHQASPVAAGPFVVCNSAAIPDTLIESVLFGHVKGAFTGATQDNIGLFEAAHGGTIVLDEIGELPPAAQAKLLRAVHQQEVQRVGSSASRKINVRIVAATHRDLRAMVTERTFREDLFFRLGILEIRVPALDDRREDLPLLLRHFLDLFSELYAKQVDGFTRKAEIALSRYQWPGNVRELEGVIGAAMMMTDGPLIDVADLPPNITTLLATECKTTRDDVSDMSLSLEEIQVAHAHRVVMHLNGDKTRAAEMLGVSRATLYRLLAKDPIR